VTQARPVADDLSHFIAPSRLETPDFTVRTYERGDGAALTQAVEPSYDHLRPWLRWPRPTQPVHESEVLVRRFLADHLTNRDHTLGIWSPDGSRLLGGTGFHLRGRPLADRVGEIGMWIRVDAAGQGLGSAVLRAMLRWGFTDWPFERLEWRCDARNTASARTAEAAGMPLEGRLRGDTAEAGDGRRTTLVFGLTRADPFPGP
jgi:RimJ/RimL family protein N-acetyltransferase